MVIITDRIMACRALSSRKAAWSACGPAVCGTARGLSLGLTEVPARRIAADLATELAPAVISSKIDISSDLVGDTGIEPVTSSV